MTIPDLTQPFSFFSTMIILYVVITARYFLVSGFFYLFFYKWFRGKWVDQKIGKKEYSKVQLRREIRWSVITGTCFAFMGTLLLLLFQQGHTRIYTDIHAYPLWWLPLSLFLSLLIDETYYYWVHRWMHHPAVFKKIHRIHHQSSISSPWTSFTFHPVEGILLSVPLILTILIFPLHFSVILVQLTIMTFSSVINHLDIEIYSERLRNHWLGKWLIGASHHSQHHRQFKIQFRIVFYFLGQNSEN